MTRRPTGWSDLQAIDGQDRPPSAKRDGWGPKSAESPFRVIKARGVIPLDRFVYALCIRQISEATACFWPAPVAA